MNRVSGELLLGICQLAAAPCDAEQARRRSLEAASGAFSAGARIVVLPELVVPGYGSDRELMTQLAEPLDGPTVRAWTELAERHGGYLAGGLCERAGEAIYNTAVVVGPGGVVLHYRKLHLFAEEAHAFSPGDLGLPVFDTPFCRIGVCVCYDLRFVETIRILALRGVDLVLVPTAWLPGFDEQLWDERGFAPQAHAAIMQANLSQVFIACASQAGPLGDMLMLGSSLVVDPTGRVIAGPLPRDEGVTTVVAVDVGAVARAQERGELIRPRIDRRTDVYALTIDGEVL